MLKPVDDLGDDERARLLEAIEQGAEDIERGDAVDGFELIEQMRARREVARR